MSDIGKVQRSEAATAMDPAELAGHEAPGAALDDPAAARERAGGELQFRASGGARGVAPMQRLLDERRAIGGQLAARVQRKGNGAAGEVAIPQSSGAKLPAQVRQRMEPKLGADLSDVQVHTGGESAQAAAGLGARAFTVGNDVHFNAGEFAPGSKEGDRLLAHELTHVVQGKKSGVQRKPEDASGAAGGEHGAGGAGAEGAGGEAAHGAEHGGHEVSHPDEPAEKEADAVADGVADQLHGGDNKGAKGKDKNKQKDKHAADAHGSGEHADSGAHGADGRSAHDAPAGQGGGAQEGAPATGSGEHAGGAPQGPAERPAPISAKFVGVGRKIYRRAGTPQTGSVATNNPQAKDDTVAPPSLDNPLLHPYFNTFKARVASLGASGHVSIGDTGGFAQSAWMQICTAVKAAAPSMADKAAYSNFAKGWLDMKSPKFQEAIAQFDKVGAELAKIGASQFNKANSFGFWSKDEGRALAESCSDLTLETSSVGSLMDGMPTLDGKKAGWDPEIWGALSNAYANAVVPQLVKGKKLNVCVGAGATAGNIWETVESRALDRGLGKVGVTLESVANYFGAAAKTKKDRKTLDLSKNVGGVAGCVYQGKDRGAAAAAAQAHYDKLPDK